MSKADALQYAPKFRVDPMMIDSSSSSSSGGSGSTGVCCDLSLSSLTFDCYCY